MARPVISFLTDFGPDSAAAICRGVILSIAPDAQIVDISHGIRKFAIGDGAYLLWATVPWMPVATHLAVVDPGVGTARLPIAVLTRRGDVLVGPDNGVLMPAAAVLGGVIEARALENRELMLPDTTSTFHGRDIFAPMAAHLALGTPFGAVGRVVEEAELVPLEFPVPRPTADGGLEAAIVYIDSFGNARLSATPEQLAAAIGSIEPGRSLRLSYHRESAGTTMVEEAPWSATFGERPAGTLLVYRDSSGSVAIAENQGNAARRLGLESGMHVRLHSLLP